MYCNLSFKLWHPPTSPMNEEKVYLLYFVPFYKLFAHINNKHGCNCLTKNIPSPTFLLYCRMALSNEMTFQFAKRAKIEWKLLATKNRDCFIANLLSRLAPKKHEMVVLAKNEGFWQNWVSGYSKWKWALKLGPTSVMYLSGGKAVKAFSDNLITT